jgi:hypothetical protein
VHERPRFRSAGSLLDHARVPVSEKDRSRRVPSAAQGGIIAIKLAMTELVDVAITKPGDEIVLSTSAGGDSGFKQESRPIDGSQPAA